MNTAALLEFIIPVAAIVALVVWFANANRNVLEHHRFLEWGDKGIESDDF